LILTFKKQYFAKLVSSVSVTTASVANY